MTRTTSVSMDFHVARTARDRYQFDDSLFSMSGNVVFANFRAARLFAQKMNQRRDLVSFPEQAVRAGQINAMGLIHEITHYVFKQYQEQNPSVVEQMLTSLNAQIGAATLNKALETFVDDFPPVAVYRREIDAQSYLMGETEGVSNREIVLEEMVLLWLENNNPAFAPFLELFDDANLERETAYPQLIPALYTFFNGMPGVDGDGVTLAGAGTKAGGKNIIDLLRAPALASPHSLEGQLEYMRTRWGGSFSLGRYLYRVLGSLDLIKEEEKPVFLGPGPATAPVYDFTGQEFEPERFSPDRDWMPRLVLMAKNAYVWLNQLAKKYDRPITQLDHIPDEELDALQHQGFTGLWLIGLWERSVASREIKHRLGNADAVASAYSLYDYQIAQGLGGEAACQNLRERAWQRGIRLSSDMVPNHMGIDSHWIVEHPDWFLSVPEPPYPSYTFNSADLSHDDRVTIVLEDHYYDKSDAAVVFKRADHNGDTRYIYHGNDGTSMPWNDTAQLDYLSAEVREAVIQTILHVARQFPVIRFDAAMTLAKKSVQRLWFPEPGAGGAIPSRAEHAMTRAQFDAAIPEEFWREVVDRVAAEVPDTLLLAEAFWLMESYFVRTLGMHRVYNSAFMHMLRDEDNAKYRVLMKNTLEFDPEILKRYVNFMSNPDERTAVDQFGKGDKYFGVCSVMLTMPGLPMFGHGQIEGFAEKYGMEYQRAYWDEQPDGFLTERHEREIFPLMHKRYLFAEVTNFRLYDFFSTDGGVNEDVFAYSNRFGDERTLVVYHNRFANVRGWVRTSASYSVKTGNGDERKLVQSTLGESLDLRPDDTCFYIFRDQTAGLEFIRRGKQLVEQGMYVELNAYSTHVFLDFREVWDNEWHQYDHLASYLDGRGVPSIEEALKEIVFQPLLQPFGELVNTRTLRRLAAARVKPVQKAAPKTTLNGKPKQPIIEVPDETESAEQLLDEMEARVVTLLDAITAFGEGGEASAPIAQGVRRTMAAIMQLPALETRFPLTNASDYTTAVSDIREHLGESDDTWGTLFAWAIVRDLGKIAGEDDHAQQSRSWIDEWLLGRVLVGSFKELGLDEQGANRSTTLIKRMTSSADWYASEEVLASQVLNEMLEDVAVQRLLGINRHQGVLWFNKEAFDGLLNWMLVQTAVELSAADAPIAEEIATAIAKAHGVIEQLRAAADTSGYQIEKLRAAVQPTTLADEDEDEIEQTDITTKGAVATPTKVR